ncbi:uncharacterized protein LOC112053238 [Bicyclus anynana]|uniref:Uncharacterized protein LOC112053238 n=1 Tax=Bicyclus anynana TaxID=110368 RepID=A0ABM3LKH7_BICAN|nr:uncharacterized protein LOC112053238 [Bicyclus anynana]
MQEMFTQIEKDVRWCNMRLRDRQQTVNERLYNWNVTGTVNYTENFVVSIEKIDLSNMHGEVTPFVVNGTQESLQVVRGQVNLREITIGFDVIANLDDSGMHRLTGEYTHEIVSFNTWIRWNPKTNDLTSEARFLSMTTGNRRVAYRPASNISEALSRGVRFYF